MHHLTVGVGVVSSSVRSSAASKCSGWKNRYSGSTQIGHVSSSAAANPTSSARGLTSKPIVSSSLSVYSCMDERNPHMK